MASKTRGYKDARAIEGMHSVTFYPEVPVFGKSDIDDVPEEHRQRCVLVSWPIGGPERVFTESDVRAMLKAVRDELEANCRWQSGVEVVSASAMRQAFHRPDVLSLDPA